MVAYSILGRGLGVPAAGWLSDVLLKRGISRMTLVFAWLMVIIVSFQLLSMQPTTMWVVAIIALVLGTAVNSFALVTVLVNETYGPDKTASVFGFVNMVGQIAGATVLAGSGYLGVALSTGERNSLQEYYGIWLAGMASVAAVTAIGAAMWLALRYRSTAPALRRRSVMVVAFVFILHTRACANGLSIRGRRYGRGDEDGAGAAGSLGEARPERGCRVYVVCDNAETSADCAPIDRSERRAIWNIATLQLLDPDQAQRTVIEHDDPDGGCFARRRLQFAQAHQQTAIPGERNDRPRAIEERCPDCGG